jgi:hypothetical protein
MVGFVSAIDVDPRDEPGDDGKEALQPKEILL